MRKKPQYSFTTTQEQRKDELNKAINRRIINRFNNMNPINRFFLTTPF